MELTLQPAEASLLHNVLRNYLSDLRTEILHTKKYELRQGLKDDAAMLRSVVARLEETGAVLAQV